MAYVPKKLREKAKIMTEGELLEAVAKWNVGAGQSVKGEATAEFVESFLDTFDPTAKTNIEKSIEGLHKIPNFKRFRKQMVMFLAVALRNYAVSGKRVDIIKLAETANSKAVARHRK